MSIEQDTGRQERREGSAELPVLTLVPKHQLMAGTTLHWHLPLHKEKSGNHQHMKARIVSTEMLQGDEGGKKEMATQIAILPKRTK